MKSKQKSGMLIFFFHRSNEWGFIATKVINKIILKNLSFFIYNKLTNSQIIGMLKQEYFADRKHFENMLIAINNHE